MPAVIGASVDSCVPAYSTVTQVTLHRSLYMSSSRTAIGA